MAWMFMFGFPLFSSSSPLCLYKPQWPTPVYLDTETLESNKLFFPDFTAPQN